MRKQRQISYRKINRIYRRNKAPSSRNLIKSLTDFSRICVREEQIDICHKEHRSQKLLPVNRKNRIRSNDR